MKQIKYSILVHSNSDEFIVYSPELSIFSSEKSLNNCYAKFQEKLSIKEKDFNLIHTQLIKLNTKKHKTREFKAFTHKACKITIVLLAVFITLILTINLLFTQMLDHNYSRLERRISETLSPSPKKERERLNRFKEKMKTASPYIRELKEVFHNDK